MEFIDVNRRMARRPIVYLFLMLFSLPVHAASFLEEIIVTAQKREQSLQDVGVSVTAFDASQMRELGITNATDIGDVTPGVLFTKTSSSSALSALSIRGIAQSDFSLNQEAPNAIYLDEVYISSPGAAAFALYDLNRIEVLRGPQGTLFGRNATGGLAHYITERPTDEFEAYLEAGTGSESQVKVEGAISGPLSDRVRGRLAASYESIDGWWKNHNPGVDDFYDQETRGVRAQLEFDVTDNLIARFTASYDERPETQVGTYKIENFYIDANGQPARQPPDLDAYGTGPGNNIIGYRDTFSSGPENSAEGYGTDEAERVSSSLALEWHLESISISSLTNYTSFESDYLEECDGSPIDYCSATNAQEMTQWSQELRAHGEQNGLNWTVGFYYLNIDQEEIEIGFDFPLLSGSDFAFDDSNIVEQETDSFSLFGQVEFELTPEFLLTVGLRYTYDEKEFDSKVFFNELGNGYEGGTGSTVFIPPLLVYDFSTETVGSDADIDDSLWSGKVQIDYSPNEDTLIYAGVSRGVKGAGFNTNIGASLTIEETPFDSESVYAYEIGSKLDLLEKSLRLNSSIYYYDYSDYQGFAFNGLQGVVGNYDGTFYGFEVEAVASLPFDTQAILGVSYIDTELEDVPTAYSGVRDQEALLAPEWTANGSIFKSIAVGDDLISINWNFTYVDEQYGSVDNNDAVYIESSFIHNARISYTMEQSGIELAAFVNNISDENRQTMAYDLISTGGFQLRSYDRPRWWGVTIRKDF